MNIVGFDDVFGWIFYFFENEDEWDDWLYGESYCGIGSVRNDEDFGYWDVFCGRGIVYLIDFLNFVCSYIMFWWGVLFFKNYV